MKRCLHTALCLFAALHLIGGHWGVLQMIAWSQMLRDYSRDKNVLVALKETFDGGHPCEMCSKIKHGKQQESREQPVRQTPQEKPFPWFNLLPWAELPEITWIESTIRRTFCAPTLLKHQWAAAPLTPPPRAARVWAAL